MKRLFCKPLKQVVISVLPLLFAFCTYAQQATVTAIYTEEDVAIFNRYKSYIAPYIAENEITILEKTALFFLGKPYVAQTLEVAENETLVVNLREFDCMTFVETVLALAKTAKSDNFVFENYLVNLQTIRYRYGVIDDYSSRMHYIVDWVYENERRGFVRDIMSELPGAVKETKSIHFMSNNRSAYPHLRYDDAMLQNIADIEQRINQRGGFYYLPKNRIDEVASKIPSMAIVTFVTSIGGLDVTHTGFTYWKDGKLTFIHASTSQNRVIIDARTLAEYCAAQRSNIGVMIIEPNLSAH